MNKLYDLRFVIGIFFLIVGVLLIGYAFISEGLFEYKMKINLACGVLFSCFAVIMLALKRRNNSD